MVEVGSYFPRLSLTGDTIILDGWGKSDAHEVGSRWDRSRGTWTLPATRLNASMVRDADPSGTDLRDALVTPWTPVRDARLYPYQQDAAGRLASAPHGMIVVHSPGLGKTATAVVAADQVVPSYERVVVVAPASLLRTWAREIAKWQTVPGDTYVVEGALDYGAATDARWIVMSWDKAARIPMREWGRGWPLVILDESVLSKSRSSKRFRAMKELRSRVDRFWLLSGSPTTRYADDLWSQLHLLWPAAFPSYWRFARRFCHTEVTPWGEKVTGTRQNRDVMEENSDLVMVVNQEDVLDLPEYLFEVIDVDLTRKQWREYRRMEKEFIAELDGEDVIAANEIARLQKLQQITSWWDGSAKHDALVDLIQDYEAPYLIWTHWRDGADALDNELRAAGHVGVHVDGGTPTKRRDEVLEQFKDGAIDYLILSIGVGKFGHTLTNAKTVFYVDKTWNADDYFQSLRRVRRIGLTHRPVVVTIRAPGTVDELVEENLEGKLGGISRLTRSRLKELLAGLGKESHGAD